MKRACKPCEQGQCENDVNACRDPRNCACCGADLELLDDQEDELCDPADWDLLDSSG